MTAFKCLNTKTRVHVQGKSHLLLLHSAHFLHNGESEIAKMPRLPQSGGRHSSSLHHLKLLCWCSLIQYLSEAFFKHLREEQKVKSQERNMPSLVNCWAWLVLEGTSKQKCAVKRFQASFFTTARAILLLPTQGCSFHMQGRFPGGHFASLFLHWSGLI